MPRNCNNKIGNIWSGLRMLRFALCAVFALICISVFSGCSKIMVAGKERNLIEHGRIRGSLDFSAEVQEDSQSGSGEGRKNKTVIFEERLRVRTKGDIYHPYLAAFSAAIGVGLVQQDQETATESERTSANLSEYDFSVQLLQNMPYNIELYTNKSNGIVPRRFNSVLKTENETSGGTISMDVPEWPMNFIFSSNNSRQDSLGSSKDAKGSDFLNRTEDDFRYSVSHRFAPNSELKFDFERNQLISKRVDSATQRKRNRYRLDHDLGFGEDARHNLNSSFELLDTVDQSERKNTRWREYLKFSHTDDLDTIHRFEFNEAKQPASVNTNVEWETGFKHRLYDSLTTTGRLIFTDSQVGDVTEIQRQQKQLYFNYSKNNRFGVFTSSYSAILSNSEQSGGSGFAAVFDESHAATSTPIVLDRRSIDVATIVLKDEFGDFYDEGSDYTITESNGRVLIDLLPFGGVAPFFTVLDGTETFLVDYNYFIEPNRKDEQLSQRYSLRQRFNNGISIFYDHNRRDDDITSNVASVTPDQLRENIYGLDYIKGKFNMYAAYQVLDSTQISSTSKRLRGSYYWNINEATKARINSSWETIDYTAPDVYQSTNFRFGGELTSELTSRWDSVNSVIYFEDTDSRSGDITGIQLSSALEYRYRQLRMSAGIDYNILDSDNGERENSLIYVRVKRMF